MQIELDQKQLEYIVTLLTRQPYAEVVQVLGSIGTQMQHAQDVAHQAAQPQPAQPAPVPAKKRAPRAPRTPKPQANGVAGAPVLS